MAGARARLRGPWIFVSHFFPQRLTHFRPAPSKMRWFQVRDAWLVINTHRGEPTAWVALRRGANDTTMVPFGVTSLHGPWSPFEILPSVDLEDGDDASSPTLWVSNHKDIRWQVVDAEVSRQEPEICISAPLARSHACGSADLAPSQKFTEPPRLGPEFELVIASDMCMPMILTHMGNGKGARRSPVALSIDGFRFEAGAFGKRNAALCGLLLDLCGDNVQRTELNMEKMMSDAKTRIHWRHQIYAWTWKLPEELVPEAHRPIPLGSFSLLVPDNRNENWDFGFVSMLRFNISDGAGSGGGGAGAGGGGSASAGGGGAGGAAAVGPSLFDEFLKMGAAKLAAEKAAAEAALAHGSHVQLDDAADGAAAADDGAVAPPAPSKRQRINRDGAASVTDAAALADAERVAASPERKHKNEEADASDDDDDADGAASAPLVPLLLRDDPTMNLSSLLVVGGTADAIASGIDLSVPALALPPPMSSLWRSPRACVAGGGAGGCVPLSVHAASAVGPPISAAERVARLATKVQLDEDDDETAETSAALAQRVAIPQDDEAELAAASAAPTSRPPSRGVPPTFASVARSASFDRARGVSDLLTFAGSAVLSRVDDDADGGGAAPASPTAALVRSLETLDLHTDEFPDCPLSVLPVLGFFSMPRIREMSEPEGVRNGTRCSYCWRWASKRCLECVSGGFVYAVCDTCNTRIGLEDVTCLACLPASKEANGKACVATRLSLKEAV